MFPALVAVLLAATAPTDTVYTADGGRITGTVLEESPTAGVTVQLPDGTVRRLEHGQVSRIEFADGTVSTPRPPPAPVPAAAPAPAAKPPIVEGPIDTTYFGAGGRVRGTVMEESAATGVKVRRLDGSVQVYPTEEIARIEYADGTVSTPRAQPRPPAPAPQARPAEAPLDTVFFMGGGRVRGTVIEEHPRTGVRVRLLDGSVQTYPREDLVRIEYADGSISRRKQPAPAPAPAAAPAPAPAAPPPAPKKDVKPQLMPIYLSLGLGGTFLGGDARQGASMASVVQTEQPHVAGEVGLRLTPSFAIGGYGDLSAGNPGASYRDSCDAQMLDCSGTTGHAGVLLRHTWSPLSDRPTWMTIGTGWEFGGVTTMNDRTGRRDVELAKYTGREYLRLGAGMDFRSNQVVALGVYGSFSIGEYTDFKGQSTAGAESIADRSTHTTAQVGLRLTLFP